MATNVAKGFNEKKPAARTGLLCVDLSKAFDVVDHHLLLKKISGSDLCGNLKRWLVAYLRDRKIRVLYQGKLSRWKKVKMGVPQGSVLSPLLFNYFINDIKSSAPIDENYADDLHGAVQHVKPADIARDLSTVASEFATQAEEHGLSLSAAKSMVTLFTPWNKEFGRLPPVTLNGVSIPQENNPKLLGVTLDPTFTFSAHASAIARKASQRVNVVRALADSSFGHDKECLTISWKSIVQPFFNYAAPIVFPHYSQASHKRLQLIQNRGLRLITGCHSAASIDHLHQEAKILPVEKHLQLLSAQHLAKTLQPHHPSHAVVNTDPGPRAMKHTLKSKVQHLVNPYLVDGVIAPGSIPTVLKSIHTDVVRETILSYGANRVLGGPAPEINPTESFLPRRTRAVLAQLRSGFCSKLNDYNHRIGKTDSDLCPDCTTAQASVQHLFSCPSFPTNLMPKDLWHRPWDVATHLNRIPAFSDLPVAGPPPPRHARRRRQPPEPPPP